MADPSSPPDTRTRPIPADVVQLLDEVDSDYLNRMLLMHKGVEQRAHMLGEEIALVMAQLGLAPK